MSRPDHLPQIREPLPAFISIDPDNYIEIDARGELIRVTTGDEVRQITVKTKVE